MSRAFFSLDFDVRCFLRNDGLYLNRSSRCILIVGQLASFVFVRLRGVKLVVFKQFESQMNDQKLTAWWDWNVILQMVLLKKFPKLIVTLPYGFFLSLIKGAQFEKF
jgi:hypothetical protein